MIGGQSILQVVPSEAPTRTCKSQKYKVSSYFKQLSHVIAALSGFVLCYQKPVNSRLTSISAGVTVQTQAVQM